MSKYSSNGFHTRDLVLNVMAFCARTLDLDIEDDEVAEKLYWVCCSLESFPEDEGFGSSDHYSYVQEARREFDIPEDRGPAYCRCNGPGFCHHTLEADREAGAV